MSFALSLAHSLVLIDGAKVLCLTFTSSAALAACGLRDATASKSKGKGKGPGQRVAGGVRKLLRRAHKLLDMLL